jgi:hypothetical protein
VDRSPPAKVVLAWEGLALGSMLGLLLTVALVYGALRNGILMPPAPGLTRQFEVFIELQAPMAGITFLMGLATASIGTMPRRARLFRAPQPTARVSIRHHRAVGTTPLQSPSTSCRCTESLA